MFTEKIHSMWLPVHVTSCVCSCVCVGYSVQLNHVHCNEVTRYGGCVVMGVGIIMLLQW